MKAKGAWNSRWIIAGFLVAVALSTGVSYAAPPVVKTVSWVASNPLTPHDTWSGKQITLKGTADVQGANIQYTWDFGDGSPVATGPVTNRYVIETKHSYTGPVDLAFTARLTVQDTSTGETGTKEYFVQIRDKSLDVEANVAIDEGLWYLHKTQRRITEGGIDYGDWLSCPPGVGSCLATSTWYGVSVSNVNAFEVNGHVESGNPDNPYVETVQRGMRRLFTWLTTDGALAASQTNPLGTFNPDSNGNGYGVYVNQGNPFYQGGMFIDAIIASGTPNAVTTTGPAPSGTNPGILGRTYMSIVQDMADAYAYCQYDGPTGGGGWRYVCNQFPDNSSCQWAAIGLIPAERNWVITIPQIVKDWNVKWLEYSQNKTTGVFGYTSTTPAAGPYATTPSGMVQMAMDGIGRGTAPKLPSGFPSWDKAETFMRNNFCNAGNYLNSVLDYYYGLFSFVKALLLHDSDGDGIAEPIQSLRSETPGVNPIDWYAAESSRGDPCNGVGRTLVNDQNANGYWSGHNYTGDQYPFETAFAIIMLNRTIFEAGAPVAVAKAVPNPGVAGQDITLDGSGSFHQDASKLIDSWEWDLNNDGTFDASGPVVTTSFAAVGVYPVKLRVTDNGVPEQSAETTITVRITTPPVAPTAAAGGPYNFCMLPGLKWFLNGTGSVNPDEGVGLQGAPGDTIQEYAWELNGDGSFNDAFGPTPDVTGFWNEPRGYNIQLRVKDTTSISFPGSGFPDLTSFDSAQVFVRSEGDPACACVSDLAARPKSDKIQLTWTHVPGTNHYNVYRGTTNGGPYIKIGSTTSTYSTYLDMTVVNGITYYYVVRQAALNEDELCESNQSSAAATARLRR